MTVLDLDWRDTLQVGDVLLEGGRHDRPRVVRKATYWKGRLACVTFSILRCSWTHRCYPVVSRTDLKYRKFCKANYRIKELRSDLDRKIQVAIESGEQVLGCCDTHGIR